MLYTSDRGIKFIAKEEAAVLVAYQDGPFNSIGFGHNSQEIKDGQRISLEEAIDLLKQDLGTREATINRLAQGKLEQWEFDALVSCCYNRGNRVLQVLSKLNVKNKNEALVALVSLSTDANGDFKLGLAGRRLREARMFMLADYGDLSTVKVWEGNPRTTSPKEIPFPF